MKPKCRQYLPSYASLTERSTAQPGPWPSHGSYSPVRTDMEVRDNRNLLFRRDDSSFKLKQKYFCFIECLCDCLDVQTGFHIIYVFCFAGWVHRLLSWKLFVPLARLCYAVYLIHYSFIKAYSSHMRKPLYYTDISIFVMYLGVLVLCIVIASVASLLIEIPFLNLDKLLWPNKCKSPKALGKKKSSSLSLTRQLQNKRGETFVCID